MKQFYLPLVIFALAPFMMIGQSFDMSLSLLGTSDTSGRYEVALLATPNFTETNGNSADIGAVLSLSDNIYLQAGNTGFVNDCTTSGTPPLLVTTCEYLIAKEEWDAGYLADPSTATSGRLVYQLLRIESGEATYMDALSDEPIILAVFEIFNSTNPGQLPTEGDITLIDNDNPILDGTPNLCYLNIRYDTASNGITSNLYNANDPNASTVNFGTLSSGSEEVIGFSLSPNPTSGIVNIKSSQGFDTADIYNINGQLLKSFTSLTDSGLNQIDVSTLSAGVYFTKLYSGSDSRDVITIKLIKK